ncbi:MAG: hypothetical protein IPH88_19595, partial [Bacteroidales bacterium]|nr:hypothetical protein [Bacteroidales bacterium]
PKIIDQISDDMVMYLINAVYFKGQWKYSFDAKNTANHCFTLEDGSISETPFMIQRCDLNYFKGADFSAVELPYNQGNYNMVVMLPDAGKTVNDLVSELSLENWNSWYSRFAKADVQIQLPKFKFEYEEEGMIPIMTDLGMGVAFNPNEADFSRINSNADLYISEVNLYFSSMKNPPVRYCLSEQLQNLQQSNS